MKSILGIFYRETHWKWRNKHLAPDSKYELTNRIKSGYLEMFMGSLNTSFDTYKEANGKIESMMNYNEVSYPKINEERQYLTKNLSRKDTGRFDKYEGYKTEVSAMYAYVNFRYGFKFSSLLLLESMKDSDKPNSYV